LPYAANGRMISVWEPANGESRITSSGPQGLVARTHGEHDGCCGTGIWGIQGVTVRLLWFKSGDFQPEANRA
jgi:hypothetical protein